MNSNSAIEIRQSAMDSSCHLHSLHSPLAAQHNNYIRGQAEYKEDAYNAHRGQNHQAVFSSYRVVVIAEQQDLIDNRSDLILRRLHQAKTQILWRELNPIEIARQPALRRQYHDATSVRVLAFL